MVGHHFAAIVPPETLVVALAVDRLAGDRWPRRAIVATAVVLGGAGIAGLAAAARGVRATGGRRVWSDAIGEVAAVLERKYPRRDVYFLDWEFQNNVFVLSNGSIVSCEAFWERDDAVRAFDSDAKVPEAGSATVTVTPESP